jgi:hypothetical protein
VVEHGLGLVVAVVRGGDARRPTGLERGPPGAPEPRGEIGAGRDVEAHRAEGQAPGGGERTDAPHLVGGLRADPVVDGHDPQPPAVGRGGPRQHVEQHDAVEPAGHGQRHGVPGRPQRVAPHRLQHPPRQPPRPLCAPAHPDLPRRRTIRWHGPWAPGGSVLLPLLAATALALTPDDAQVILQIEAQRLPPLALARYVGDDDAETRARAARALGRLRTAAALAPLKRLAADPDPAVRAEAAFALGRDRKHQGLRRRIQPLPRPSHLRL